MSKAQIDFPLQNNFDSDNLMNSAQPILLQKYHNLSQKANPSYEMDPEEIQEENKDQIGDLKDIKQFPPKKRSNSFNISRKPVNIQFRNQRKHKIRDTHRQEQKVILNQQLINQRFEKTGKEMTLNDQYYIEDILQQHFLFQKMDDQDEISKLAKEFYHVSLKGDTVFEEGDVPSLFYIIEKGSLDKIFMGKVREVLQQEETFGDFDILRQSLRTATIKAQPGVQCEFWCIDKVTYMNYAEDIVKDEVLENKEIIKGHHFFDIMTEEQQDEILHVTFTKQFKIGQTLCIQDFSATSYYIVKQGYVIVQDKNTQKEIGKLGPGESIAYEEFIYSKNYKYDYIAYNSRVMCLKIDKSNIERYIGEKLINFYYRNVQRHSCENNEVLKNLDQTDIERIIAKSVFHECVEGEVIIKKGTIPKQIFFILRGTANISYGEKHETYAAGSVILENKIEAPADFIMENEGMLALFDFSTFLEYFGDQENLGECVQTPENPYYKLFALKKKSSSSEDETDTLQSPEIKILANRISHFKKQSTFEIRGNKSCDNLKGLLDSYQKQSQFQQQNSIEFQHSFNGNSSFNLKEKENIYTDTIKNVTIGSNNNSRNGSLTNISNMNISQLIQQNSSLQQNPGSQNNSFIHEQLEQINQKVIQRFQIEDFLYIKQLGKGFFGVTHLCQHKQSQNLYAIKIISKSDVVEKHMDKQVIEEKIILETLEHPFIMKYHGSFMDDYNVFFVLQYITGIELFDVIRQKGLFSPEDLLYYAASLVNILEYLHEAQIVYRDLKPENIMINLEGEIKLIDLGASTRLTEKGGRTFTMTGTPHYMAPEITDGKGYSYYVDLWSLGIVLYECLCGPTPFGTNDLEDPYEIYQAIKNNKLEFPDFVENEDIIDLITKLLNKKPFRRVGGSWATLKQHPYFDIKGKFDWTQLQEFYGYKPPYQPENQFEEEEILKILEQNIQLADKVQKIPYNNQDCKYDKEWENKFQFDPDLIEDQEIQQMQI